MSTEPDPGYYGPEPGYYEPDESWSLAEKIEWHLARIARHESRVADMDAECRRMIERHQEWNERRTAESRRKATESRVMVEALMLDAIAADPKAAKSLELPSGSVTTRAGSTVVRVTDMDALKAWALANNEKVLRWKAEADLAAIKEALADGEAVPGVERETKDRTVTVRVGKVAPCKFCGDTGIIGAESNPGRRFCPDCNPGVAHTVSSGVES
jgi:hypothetical protein